MEFKEISDLGLITGLLSLGYAPKERRRDGKRVIYVFESSDNLKQLCEDFFSNRMSVDAQTFHTTMKAVKSSIYQMEKSNG